MTQVQEALKQAVQEELHVKVELQGMLLLVEVAAQETMAAVHNPMRKEEELRLLEAVDTKAGDEVQLANRYEAMGLKNCI